MPRLMTYSAHMLNSFKNDVNNIVAFQSLLMQAANRNYSQYPHDEMNEMIRTQFNQVLGIDFRTASNMERRQAMRLHAPETYSLVETVLADRLQSGWDSNNAFFMNYVEQRNLAQGDMNEFWVEDNSLLTVSRFAGNHHDIVRQALLPGKSFTIDTEWKVIKVYADFRLMMTGRIDFAEFIDRCYRSIEVDRYDAIYEEFMALDEAIPTDLIHGFTFSENTRSDIINHIEMISAATGSDITLVGTRPALEKLQNTVNYNMWSDAMKDERHNNQILGNWEGYDLLPLRRVNKLNSFESIYTAADNAKILIMPKNMDKPIKLVVEGDVEVYESGRDGMKKDMTVDTEIQYCEGIGTVVNQYFGELRITG